MLKGWVAIQWTSSELLLAWKWSLQGHNKSSHLCKNALYHNALEYLCSSNVLSEKVHYYRIARNFGGKIFWLIAENISFGGIYFGGEPVLAIKIFITKMANWSAGNLAWPWTSFSSVRTKWMMKCYWKLDKSLLHLLRTVFVVSDITATVYTSFGLPSSHW